MTMGTPQIPSVDSDSKQFPDAVRARIAQNIKDSSTPESAAVAALGTPRVLDGNRYLLQAGVIRNMGDGNGWQLLKPDSNHYPLNITSIETIDDTTGPYGYIRVHYDNLVGASGRTVTFLAVPDETLGRNGFTLGTSVTQQYTDIRIAQSAPAVSDYVYYDGTNWSSFDGKFTPTWDAANKRLVLTHEAIPQSAQYAVEIASRSTGARASVSQASGTLSATQLTLEFRDGSLPQSDYIRYDGTNWVSTDGTYTFSYNSGLLTLTHPSIPLSSVDRIKLTPRGGQGGATPGVDVGSSPTSATSVRIGWYDTAGALITTPNTNMRVYVEHGGGEGELLSPNTDMRFFVSHGGGTRQWKPSALNTNVYPGCNIWLFGIIGEPIS